MSRRCGSVSLAGEVPVGRGRLDFAPPHHLDRREVSRVDRHAPPYRQQPVEQHDRGDARQRRQHLARAVRIELAAVEVRDQIRHRDVEEARRGEGEHEGARRSAQARRRRTRRRRPTRPEAPETSVEQRARAPGSTRPQQDRQVADFLRNLVRGDGDGGVDAERDRLVRTAAPMIAPSMKLWNGVAESARARRLASCTSQSVRVAVPEQHQLLENEEDQDAGQQRRRTRAAAESWRAPRAAARGARRRAARRRRS